MTTILAMPCFNEADGVEEFLNDILSELGGTLNGIVIVDDCSTDRTKSIIAEFANSNPIVNLFSNDRNLGHGPTLVNAINFALGLHPKIVITVDGDGQFYAKDIKARLDDFKNCTADVLECGRSNRTDPFFRKLVTFSLKMIIWFRTLRWPLDANTPLRIYDAKVLQHLVRQIPEGSLIPNLRISSLTRKGNFRYLQKSVVSIQRRGISSTGSTWKAKFDWLPSKRFIKFCNKALGELFRFPI